MQHRLFCFCTIICVMLWTAGSFAGEAIPAPPAKLRPEIVSAKNLPGPVSLTLDGEPEKGKELTNTENVLAGSELLKPTGKGPAFVTFIPPRRETDGELEIRMYNSQNELLASGRLRYVSEKSPSSHSGLAIFYVVIILVFPFVLMLYDLRKTYAFARETKSSIIDKASSDGLTAEELRMLLNELNQSPPGIPGLARNSIAFMLMMILAVAIVHILAVDPPGAKDIPTSIDRILVLLTGLLTSVVSFYFGSRAAEQAQQGSKTETPSDTGSKQSPITFVPKFGAPGEPVTISGPGLGAEQGSVMFGDVAADMSNATWTDREVTVSVPATAKPGKVNVTVIPKGTDRKLVSNVEFQVQPASSSTLPANAEDRDDGCSVDITDATPDHALPAAEGGVQK